MYIRGEPLKVCVCESWVLIVWECDCWLCLVENENHCDFVKLREMLIR